MIFVACRLGRKERIGKKELEISFIKKKKKTLQLTVKAPGTETITTFLSFHSSVDSLTADRLIVSNFKKGSRGREIFYDGHMCSS